jgi:mevalonate kinase
MQQSKQAEFMKMIQNELIPLNQTCITYFLSGHWEALLPAVKTLSALTLEYFEPMIPENLKPLWDAGLKNEDYFLKLCGSGGGGMLLGFTTDLSKVSHMLKTYSFSILHRF